MNYDPILKYAGYKSTCDIICCINAGSFQKTVYKLDSKMSLASTWYVNNNKHHIISKIDDFSSFLPFKLEHRQDFLFPVSTLVNLLFASLK